MLSFTYVHHSVPSALVAAGLAGAVAIVVAAAALVGQLLAGTGSAVVPPHLGIGILTAGSSVVSAYVFGSHTNRQSIR